VECQDENAKLESQLSALREENARWKEAALKGGALALSLSGCPLKEPYRDKILVAVVELKEAMKKVDAK
jgi:hypothetical protein